MRNSQSRLLTTPNLTLFFFCATSRAAKWITGSLAAYQESSVTQYFLVNKRGKDTPIGAFHASNTLIWFPDNTINETVGVDALINFMNALDPNQPAKISNPPPSGEAGIHPRRRVHHLC
ncbi:hypothetical protein B0H19DRAFT_212084 [Mycena capillaripes]|nr:hypothetical protein B0H19DRAFT_212084 [Mycena capillaripes]